MCVSLVGWGICIGIVTRRLICSIILNSLSQVTNVRYCDEKSVILRCSLEAFMAIQIRYVQGF